jgi:hypothetical protein
MKILLFALIGLFLSPAYSQIQFGGLLGYRSNQAETDIKSAHVNARGGIQFGIEGLVPLGNSFEIRSGFTYAQRYSEIQNTAQGTVSVDYAYIDVPATLMYRFVPAVGIFAGPVLGFNQSKNVNCSLAATCAAVDVQSVIIPWQLGLNFRFLSQMGAEIFYEYVPGDLSTNISDMKSVGGNLLIYFE